MFELTPTIELNREWSSNEHRGSIKLEFVVMIKLIRTKGNHWFLGWLKKVSPFVPFVLCSAQSWPQCWLGPGPTWPNVKRMAPGSMHVCMQQRENAPASQQTLGHKSTKRTFWGGQNPAQSLPKIPAFNNGNWCLYYGYDCIEPPKMDLDFQSLVRSHANNQSNRRSNQFVMESMDTLFWTVVWARWHMMIALINTLGAQLCSN